MLSSSGPGQVPGLLQVRTRIGPGLNTKFGLPPLTSHSPPNFSCLKSLQPVTVFNEDFEGDFEAGVLQGVYKRVFKGDLEEDLEGDFEVHSEVHLEGEMEWELQTGHGRGLVVKLRSGPDQVWSRSSSGYSSN